ncbi:uncharacterized protein BDV17DRAFT_8384 [Aspergillus undulatus]|uniref:uncharacterized protein n=1 Tax=Aspergillus undulatus TaxID=1810928 RepID=UPI003CCDF42E
MKGGLFLGVLLNGTPQCRALKKERQAAKQFFWTACDSKIGGFPNACPFNHLYPDSSPRTLPYSTLPYPTLPYLVMFAFTAALRASSVRRAPPGLRTIFLFHDTLQMDDRTMFHFTLLTYFPFFYH